MPLPLGTSCENVTHGTLYVLRCLHHVPHNRKVQLLCFMAKFNFKGTPPSSLRARTRVYTLLQGTKGCFPSFSLRSAYSANEHAWSHFSEVRNHKGKSANDHAWSHFFGSTQSQRKNATSNSKYEHQRRDEYKVVYSKHLRW